MDTVNSDKSKTEKSQRLPFCTRRNIKERYKNKTLKIKVSATMLDEKVKLLDGFCSIPDITEYYHIIITVITNYTMLLDSGNTRIEIYLNKIGEQKVKTRSLS